MESKAVESKQNTQIDCLGSYKKDAASQATKFRKVGSDNV